MTTTLELIEELREEIPKLQESVEVFDAQIKTLKQCLHETRNTLHSKQQQLVKLEKRQEAEAAPVSVRVSDHAVLRYMDRVLGLGVEELREQMLTEKHRAMIKFAKNCRIKFNGVELVVKDYVVTTIIAEGEE